MDRTKADYWVDVGLFLSFLAVALTGMFKLRFIYPLFGLERSDQLMRNLSTLHDWSGVVLSLLVLIHLILHWTWIKEVSEIIFKKQEN